jgi:hypothetical protein
MPAVLEQPQRPAKPTIDRPGLARELENMNRQRELDRPRLEQELADADAALKVAQGRFTEAQSNLARETLRVEGGRECLALTFARCAPEEIAQFDAALRAAHERVCNISVSNDPRRFERLGQCSQRLVAAIRRLPDIARHPQPIRQLLALKAELGNDAEQELSDIRLPAPEPLGA